MTIIQKNKFRRDMNFYLALYVYMYYCIIYILCIIYININANICIETHKQYTCIEYILINIYSTNKYGGALKRATW